MRKADHDYVAARRLRREMSLPERLLWRELRGKPDGVKFRRQHPLGPYVLDFYCPSARQAIEIDGMAHDMGDRPARDASRDAFVNAHGIAVARIPAAEVLASPVDAAEAILALCRERALPSPHRG